MDISVLSNELKNDPSGRDYAKKTAQEIADSLNAVDRTIRKPVTIRAMYTFFLQNFKLMALKAAAADVEHPAHMAAVTALDVLDHAQTLPELDMDHPTTKALVAMLVEGGILNQEEGVAFDALANVSVSRAQELGLPPVSAGYVAEAMAMEA